MRSEFAGRLQHLVVVGELAVPVERESHPLGVELRVVERVHDHDDQRQVEESVGESAPRPTAGMGAYASPTASRADTALADPRREPREAECQHRQHDREHAAERPVARLEELLLDDVADQAVVGAAQDVRNGEDAERRDEDERRARVDARQRERKRDAPEALPRAGAQVLRGIEQRAVVLFEVRVKRQHHERQVHVDEAHEDRERAEEQRHGLDAEQSQKAIHRARDGRVGAEDDHPCVDADEEVAPERQDHEKQQEVAMLAVAARDQRRQRIREHEADQRRGDARTRTT